MAHRANNKDIAFFSYSKTISISPSLVHIECPMFYIYHKL